MSKVSELAEVIRARFPDGKLPWGTLRDIADEFGTVPSTVYAAKVAAGATMAPPTHGTLRAYRAGCKCRLCLWANAAHAAKYAGRKAR